MRQLVQTAITPSQITALLLVVAAAVYVQARLGFHTDVSWLLTLNERLLAGEQLYVDLLVVNPAMPVWFYRIPVLIAQATGLRAEIVLHGMIAATAVASYALTSHLLMRAKLIDAAQSVWFGIILFALLYVIAAYTYAQREFIGLLGLLPWLAMQAWRAASPRAKPGWPLVLLCGLGCAAMVLVKPYYVLTVLAPVAALCAMRRSLRPAFHAENIIGALIVIALTGLFLILHPAFFSEMIMLILSAYAPHMTVLPLQVHTAALLVVLIAVVVCIPLRQWSPLTVLLFASAVGHITALWLMGRAFPYHAYPAYVLATLAVLTLYRRPVGEKHPGPVPAFAAALAIAMGWGVFSGGANLSPDLKNYLADNHRGATFMPISNSMIDGHPVSRVADLEFVAPAAFLSITTYGDQIIADHDGTDAALLSRIDTAKQFEWQAFRETLFDTRPEIVIMPVGLRSGKPDAVEAIWSNQGPKGRPSDLYRLETTIDGYEVYMRR
ncbi:MAG: hypothetical protein AAF940_12230 [Pseudomonadota bacterium]